MIQLGYSTERCHVPKRSNQDSGEGLTASNKRRILLWDKAQKEAARYERELLAYAESRTKKGRIYAT